PVIARWNPHADETAIARELADIGMPCGVVILVHEEPPAVRRVNAKLDFVRAPGEPLDREILAVGSRILLLREIAAKKLGCEELVLLEAVQAPAIRERPDVRVPTVAAGLPEFVRVNERPFRHEQRSGLHSI